MRVSCACCLLGIMFSGVTARPIGTVETPFCHEIRKKNGGCDPACGFVFIAAKDPSHEKSCVRAFPTTTPYCEEISNEPKYAGCSKVCGLEWSANDGVCLHVQQSEGSDIWSPFCNDLHSAPHFGCDASCGYTAGSVGRYHVDESSAAADTPSARRHSSHRACVVANGNSVPRTPYCELLSKPKHTGCSLACGFFHSDALHVPCMKKKLKDEL